MRAMQRIMGLRTQREALEEEKTRLQWKLKMYQKQTDGIGGLWHDQSRLDRHIQALEEQLGDTREDLQDLLTRAGDIEDFLDAVIEDREPLVNGEEGRKVVEMFTAIYRSQRDGKPIKFPLKPEIGREDYDGRLTHELLSRRQR